MFSKKIVQLALTLSQVAIGLASTLGNTTECTADTFTYPTDQLSGTSSLGITAAPVFNYTAISVIPGTTVGASFTVDFCNVTVTYTHPGWNDTIHSTVWLPAQDNWNGRLQALGGGGYSASFGALYTTQAVAKGYIAIDTDAGHVKGDAPSLVPNTWALTSPGNVNLYLLEDWGSRSLHEMAVVGKAVTEAFYGAEPVYSYFSGCSGGGRQALEIAQKYPEDFDGIIAAAPALNLENFIPAGYWTAQVMRDLNTYPPACEIDAFTEAAIQECDELDGLQDGIIALPELCAFDPHTVVGQSFNCSGTMREFTSAGASVVQAAWTGPRSQDGMTGWFGLNKDASLTSYYAATTCTSNSTCSAAPLGLFSSWITYFSAKDPDFDLGNMTDTQFFSYLKQSQDEYHSIVAAANPDLSGFRAAGGKMISWQGLADEAIPPNGAVAYFQQVQDLDSDAQSFVRFYQAPGVGHCQTTVGPNPNGAFDQLVAWVENAVVPETLTAVDTSGNTRNLCSWPLQQIYVGGNSSDPDSFNCTLAAYPSFAADFPFYDSF
ncbi:carboxylic ester hydrolase-8 [Coleophoma cylindrospora]|uniref:Carboxylic ester hydrolase n=1 Tax=Coleophoma cylindrospora TaxID=1849047 RepID=A0A3D8RUE8_9HELO|nr:carboxylic ester hydrolase-8 [Coleophoma cylindrospora]